jgi:hypothetical protein
MPAKDELSDDYVADLLAKDAKSISAKYCRYGLQELLPKRYGHYLDHLTIPELT